MRKTVGIDRQLARKVLGVVDQGLCRGLGTQIPGQMCVEAAVCYALGEPHGEEPSCVNSAVRAFKIALNDSSWSSNAARAKGMRRLAIAQLGTDDDSFSVEIFVKELALSAVRTILPPMLRMASTSDPLHANKMYAAAIACEVAKDLYAAEYAANAAKYAAEYAANAAKYAAEYAEYAAKYAANAAEYAAKYAAEYAANAAEYAEYAAEYAAKYAAEYAAKYAAEYAEYAADEILSKMAECGVEALKAAGAKGCEFLDLTE